MRNSVFLSAVIGVLFGLATAAQADTTLEDVREKGFVQCGVSQFVPGFSNADDAGNWSGIDVDVCRAVAGTVFDDDRTVISQCMASS